MAVWPFTTMMPYWIAYALAQKITETTKLSKICYPFNINRMVFDEVKLRINSE